MQKGRRIMNDEPPQQQQTAREMRDYALSLLRAGRQPEEVRVKLRERGLSEDATRAVLSRLVIPPPRVDENAFRDAAKKHMLYGALWCVGGIILTAGTYQAASNDPRGGSYVIAWGAIAFGFIDFLRGLFAYLGRH